MLKYISSKLEHPEFPLLGPNINALKFWGLLLPEKSFKKWIYVFLHLSVIVFTASEYVEIWFVKYDMNLLLTNLKITLLATVSVSKVSSFLIWQKHWKVIMKYVNEADKVQRDTQDLIKINIINGYTRYSRKVTYFYWILMYTTVAIVICQPIYKYTFLETYRENVKNGTEVYTPVVSSWVPFNKNLIGGYLLASLYQSFSAIYGGGWITSFDTNAIVIMVFFRGELLNLRNDSCHIFGSEDSVATNGEARERLIRCYKRHVELVKAMVHVKEDAEAVFVYIKKILKYLNFLEDPERPLLGPNIKWLKVWGLVLPNNKTMRLVYMILHVLFFTFVVTEYIDICISRYNMNQVLQNMKYAMLATVNFSKIATFVAYQDIWKSVIQYVSVEDFERRKVRDIKSKIIIGKYTQYCRKMTYFYWFLTYATVFMTVLQPLFHYLILYYKHDNNTYKYIEIISSWIPIDKQTLLGYWLRIIFQIFASFFAGGVVSSFDTTAIGMTIFFKGELLLLRKDSQNIFGTEKKPSNKTEAIIKLRDCHRRHEDLIKYSRLFGACLSPIMLFYVIVCSVMLCATAYQMTNETSAFQRLIAAEYLIFGVSQLFLFCWHSNEVFYVSKDLTLGPYESIWWSRDVSEQKNISILTHQFDKTIVFSAGPFTDITVATFISILKGAYSYYTLLSQSQEG